MALVCEVDARRQDRLSVHRGLERLMLSERRLYRLLGRIVLLDCFQMVLCLSPVCLLQRMDNLALFVELLSAEVLRCLKLRVFLRESFDLRCQSRVVIAEAAKQRIHLI